MKAQSNINETEGRRENNIEADAYAIFPEIRTSITPTQHAPLETPVENLSQKSQKKIIKMVLDFLCLLLKNSF